MKWILNYWLTIVFSLSLNCMEKKPENLYALEQFFKNNLQPLSPLQGVTGIETSFIKNLCQTGNENHFTIQLVKSLFHILESGELRTTRYEPYSTFKPKYLAHLAYKINKLDQRPIPLHELVKTSQKSSERILEFYKLLSGAHEESLQGVYPPHLPLQILLSFLYQKSTIRDLHDYKKEIRKLSGDKTTPEGRTTPYLHVEAQNLIAWLESPSEKNDPCDHPALNNLEEMIYAYRKRHEINNKIPPRLIYDYYKTENGIDIGDCCENTLLEWIHQIVYDPNLKKLSLELLGLTTLIKLPTEFYRFLQFRSLATAAEANDTEKRKIWFEQISNIPDALYRRTRKDGWKYEVHPSAANFIFILRQILGHHKPMHSITSSSELKTAWDSFCQDLQEFALFKLKCTQVTFKSDVTNSATFKYCPFMKPEEKKQFTLHIQPEHAYVVVDNQQERKPVVISPNGDYIPTNQRVVAENYFKKYCDSSTPNNYSLLMLFASSMDPHIICQFSDTKHLLLAQPTYNDAQRLLFSQRLLKAIQNTQDPFIQNLLKNIKYFNNEFHKRLILCAMINKKLYRNESVIEELPKLTASLWQWEQYQVALALILKKAWEIPTYKELILKIMDNLPDYEEFGVKAEEATVIIDSKVFFLEKLAINGGLEDDDLKNKFNHIVTDLSDERKEKLFTRISLNKEILK